MTRVHQALTLGSKVAGAGRQRPMVHLVEHADRVVSKNELTACGSARLGRREKAAIKAGAEEPSAPPKPYRPVAAQQRNA